MAAIRAAEVRDNDGIIRNIVMQDTEAPAAAPTGYAYVADPGKEAQIGGAWDGVAQTFLPAQTDTRTLEEIRANAIVTVDRGAEAARERWITAGPGQALIYEAKRTEAEAWAAAGSPHSQADYPFMRARAARLNGVLPDAATEAQMQAVATDWLAKAAIWHAAGMGIEDVREQAKEDIAAATDAETVDSVLASLAWPR